MNRVLLGAAAVALALVVAGCNAPADPPQESTLTPVPLPESTATRGPEELAPGVDATGVYDPVRLATAHARALANVSYTVERNVTRRRPDGAVVSRLNRTVRVAADRSRYRYRVVLSGSDGRRIVERYADGERIYARTATRNDTTYRLVYGPDGGPLAPRDASFGRATNRRGLVQLFARVDFDLAGRTSRNGTVYYRLATPATGEGVPEETVRGTLLVSERGLVREYHLAYRTRHGGRERVVTVNIRFVEVGATHVTPPAWYDTARRAVDDTPTPSSLARGGLAGGSSPWSSAAVRP